MARGRNSKSSVLKDEARERRVRGQAAGTLDDAAGTIRLWFTGEGELLARLDYLAEQIRAGHVDYTDRIEP